MPKDLVEDGVNGYVIEPGDIDGLANGLKRVLANPAAAAQMGMKSIEKIDAYSFEQNVLGLRHALETIVPGSVETREQAAARSSDRR